MTRPKKPQTLTAGREAAIQVVVRKCETGYAIVADMTDREALFDPTTHKDRAAAITAALALLDRNLAFSGFQITARGRAK